jgi:hypothetical protein
MGSRIKRASIAALWLLTLTFFSGLAGAQTFYGSIGGIVKDSSGAVMPGVQVAVTDTATQVVTNTMTNGDGNYLVSFLKPSVYRVRFRKQGFREDVEENIQLVMNQKERLDVVLRVGSPTQRVTVSATGTQLSRVSAEIGGQVMNTDLVQLPQQVSSHGGSVLQVAPIFPGMSGVSPCYGNPADYSIGGGLTANVPVITDGLPSNRFSSGDIYAFVPSPESTDELQVLTTPYSAQYGQTGGGVILTTTKSGTNDLHGSAFEIHNDQTLNALDFFDTTATSKPEDIYNYFGGSLGGPVYIPGIWNGRKHHTYFFTDWEDTINLKPSLDDTDVPTMAELSGDFSGPPPEGGAAYKIYNPATTQVVNGKVVRQQFAGNVIPESQMDPIAAKILSYYPAPNCSLDTFNYCVDPVGYHSYLYNTDRVDQAIGNYDRIWFRFARDGPWTGAVDYIPNAANTAFLNGWRDYQGEGTWNHIFSPSVDNEFRVGIVENDQFEIPPTEDVSSIGLQGVPLTQFPDVSVTGLTSLGGSTPLRYLWRNWSWNDDLEVQKGRHSLHIGGEFIRYMYNDYTPGVLSGGYSFTGTFTSLPGTADTGLGVADLELGDVDSATISTTNYTYRERMNTASLYTQDDFKATSRLTLNLGLRWEFDGPWDEVNNQMYTFNPSITDPTTGKLGAVQFADENGAPDHFVPNTYKGFVPRAGFAYGLPHNTVLRGGYGIFEIPNMMNYVSYGLVSKYSRGCDFVGSNSYTPAFQLNQGVPACGFDVNAAGLPNIPTSLTKPTSSVGWQELNNVLPYLQEWSFGIQHQFAGWLAEADYEGNKGTHELVTLPMNQIVPTPGCCYGVSDSQTLRPYPQFLNVTYDSESGISNYNGLMLKLQHYWRHGLSTIFTYTWAKTMNNVDGPNRSDAVSIQNVYDLAAQYGVSMLDIPNRFTAAYVLDVPVGAGGKLAAGIPVLSRVIGHWEVTGITQFQTGYPYTISQTNTTGWFNGAQYADKVGNPYLSEPTVAEWFNPKAFQITPPDEPGTAPRAALFGPGLNDWDLSVMRNFPVKERVTLQFRADFYNAFNHPSFDDLNTTITSPGFGAATGDIGARTIQLDARISF